MTVSASWAIVGAAFGLVVAVVCALAISLALLDQAITRYFPRRRP